ncbi:MAG TPA: trehalose-phosphatase [Acidisphaera sp.]|nr:trehalose-phosphatase [Acidisphaera sp.]
MSQHPRLPAPSRAALLLDLDGTLIDIAPRPELVTVPDDLPASLLAVRRRLDDALAVISGRPVAQIDALLPGIAYAAAGEHGGAYRFAPGAELYRPDLPHAPDEWVRLGEAAVAAHPGAFVERKTHGFVLHYRAMPDAEGALREAALAIVGAHPDFVVMPARMAWEVKPAAADKGVAVRVLMDRPPFAGRKPIFIGDDVTDQDGIATAREMGGAGLFVPDTFGDPSGVRAWLARAAESEDAWPDW